MFVVMTVVLVRVREEEVTTVDISRLILEAFNLVKPVGEISTESAGCLREHVLCVGAIRLRRRRLRRGRWWWRFMGISSARITRSWGMGPKDKKIQIKNEKEDFRILYSINNNNKIKRDLTVTLDIELSAQREFKFSVIESNKVHSTSCYMYQR